MECDTCSTCQCVEAPYAMTVRSKFSTRGTEDGILFRLLPVRFRQPNMYEIEPDSEQQKLRDLSIIDKHSLADELDFIGEREKQHSGK